MKRKLIIKILGAIVGLVVLLIIVAYILAITHRKEILNTITTAYHDKLNGDLTIGDLDFTVFDEFPSLTVRLENISVTDSSSAVLGDTLLRAEKVSFRLHLIELITGNIHLNTVTITNASILVMKYKNGEMNTPKARVVNTSAPAKSGALPKLNKIFLKNVSFKMIDSVKMKFFGLTMKDVKLKSTDGNAPMNYDMDAAIHFDGLIFNYLKGGYLTNQDVQLNAFVTFDPDTKLLTLSNGDLVIQKQKLMLAIKMNFSEKTMSMKFDTKSMIPSVAYSILTPAISNKINIIQLEKPVIASVVINGSIAPGSKPAVDVYFKTTGNTLNYNNASFDSLRILGQFTNHIDSTKINDDHNTKVMIPVFSGSIYGIPVTLKAVLTDFITPDLALKAQITYDGQQQGEITTERFKFLNGLIKIDLSFHGPLTNFVDTVHQQMIGDGSGEISIQNASFNQLSTGYEFRNVTGHLSFKKPDVIIDSIQLSLNGNNLKMSGNAQNVISFIFVPTMKAVVNLDIKAGIVDFNKFSRPEASAAKKKAATKKSDKKSLSSTMDWLAQKFDLNINLVADKLITGNFVATNIQSNIVIDDDFIKISNAGMSTCGGSMTLNADITGTNSPKHFLNTSISVKNVRIDDLMYSFNNFNQKSITNKNVSGTVSATASLSAALNNKYGIIGSSMKGKINTTVKNGELKNIEGLEKVSNYVFKNRDFSNIQFANLYNRASITGTMIDIDTLHIFSSVITLFINGVFDFNNANTNLLISIPMSNLKKMEDEERMAQSDSIASKGGKVVLRATNGKDGKLNIAPVMFGKKDGKKEDKKDVKNEVKKDEKKDKEKNPKK
ncbi:MAG: AsmA-like C-terminal region-containing protein [Chitinophagales bacterium]